MPNRRQAVISTNANQIHWNIYAALGGDELIRMWLDIILFIYEVNVNSIVSGQSSWDTWRVDHLARQSDSKTQGHQDFYPPQGKYKFKFFIAINKHNTNLSKEEKKRQKHFLTHWSPLGSHVSVILVKIGSDNDLLPDSSKSLPEVMCWPCSFILG